MQNIEIPSRRSDPYTPKRYGWLRLKSLIRSRLRKYPAFETGALNLWRNIKYIFWKTRWKLAAWVGSWTGSYVRNIDIDKIYWISPQKIPYSSMREFSLHNYKGQILGGDWDRLVKRFDALDIHVAIRQVCIEGNRWEDTVFYQRVLDRIKKGQILWSCQDESGLNQRCRYLESLFHNIQKNGFKSQQELYLSGKTADQFVAEEEISVCIGRFGDLLFSDGAHRLSIAKLLDVPRIPVKVTVRHSEWIKFRNELLGYAQDENITKDGKLYQPITHPDLIDLPVTHNCEDRYRLIKGNISVKQGRVLDIGANLGYFCHRFEEEGFDCFAVENDPSTVSFLKRLARAEARRFKVITESVFDSNEIRNIHFEIVLALNIFHHFLKTQDDFDRLVDLLQNLQMDELFFEPHLPNEPQMKNAYKNYSPQEFVQFIINNTCLKNAIIIGVMNDGRHLYKLYC